MANKAGTAKIALPYQRKRAEFGRPPPVKQDALGGPWVSVKKAAENTWTMFQDRSSNAETLEEVFPNPEEQDGFMDHPCCKGQVQRGPTASRQSSNTPQFVQESRAMHHDEGGWPEKVDHTDPEQTARFRKRVEKEQEYVNAVKGMASNVEHTLRQNSAIDIYEEYFSGLQVEHTTDPPSAKNLTAFKDPQQTKRTVTNISWNPDGGRKFACAYSNLAFQQSPDGMQNESYIWDVSNPNFPDITLKPPNPLVSLEYHPRDPNILMGGTYNGLLAFWDLRETQAEPTKVSLLATSHRDPVYDIAWVQSKNYECMTTSTDGQVLWWDSRKMSEPSDHYNLDTTNKQSCAAPDSVVKSGVQGGTALAYDISAGPLKFLVGTEAGYILSCDKKSKTPTDRIQAIFTGHYGPVYSLQRHPQFAAKYFLSVGDWTCKLWMQDVKTPIMSTKYDQCYLTSGCWSPTRAGVFYMTKISGVFEVWDLLYKQNEPTLSIPIGDAGLQCMKIEKEQGRLVTFGSADGSTALYEISTALTQTTSSEKTVIMGMLDRESNREKQLVTLDKERRGKLKKLEMEAAAAAKQADINPDEISDSMIAELEKEVNELLMQSGQCAPRHEGQSEGPKDETLIEPTDE